MKKALIAAALCLSAHTAGALEVELDKVVHATGSGVVAETAAVMLGDSRHPIIYPFALSFGLGVAKEVYDSRKGGSGFDRSDLAADFIGAASGALLGRGVYLYATRNGGGVGVHTKF